MGLLDLPGPLFGLIDQLLAGFLPGLVRLIAWGILAGWLTMVVYRRLSNQERIQVLKGQQREQQRLIADFDGEIGELFPLIRHALGLGMRQLGLSIGPALLATIPVLFLIVWVAGAFGYEQPERGAPVALKAVGGNGAAATLEWQPATAVSPSGEGWVVEWPATGSSVRLASNGTTLVEFPTMKPIPVIHKKQWWNLLMANPIGYLPDDAPIEAVEIGLPPQRFLPFGPGWLQGWMFSFFTSFLLASIAFKLLLKID
jgi:hypothetical protein